MRASNCLGVSSFSKVIGMYFKTCSFAVLHTWGQQLSLHPHLHCIVPGGGVTKNGEWQNCRTDGEFLFPVKALSKVFRAKYCQKLKEKNP